MADPVSEIQTSTCTAAECMYFGSKLEDRGSPGIYTFRCLEAADTVTNVKNYHQCTLDHGYEMSWDQVTTQISFQQSY